MRSASRRSSVTHRFHEAASAVRPPPRGAPAFDVDSSGSSVWHDAFATRCFNRHQRLDKGFGPALGPRAAETTADFLTARGYAVTSAASDWHLDMRDGHLQTQLLDGWLAAALEIAPEERPRLTRWHAAHRRRIDAGGTQLHVGHRDLAGRAPAA
jgi:hypothetical protein